MSKADQIFTHSRVFLAICIAISVVGIVLILIINNRIVNATTDDIKQELENELDNRKEMFLRSVGENIDALHFLMATPPISAIARSANNNGIDPLDGAPVETWHARIATILEAYLENVDIAFQARIIMLDEDGSEVVRVHRRNGNIEITPKGKLQRKSKEPYFKIAAELMPGEVYVSPINLNREWGKIAFPPQPTYRVIRTIFDENNRRIGFLILNQDAQNILKELSYNIPNHFSLYITNPDGGYLLHENADLAFQFEYDNATYWQDEFIQATKSINDFGMQIFTRNGSGAEFWFVTDNLPLGPTPKKNYVTLNIGIERATLNRMIVERQISTLASVAGLTLLFLVVIYGYQRNVSRRLAIAKQKAEYHAIFSATQDAVVSLSIDGLVCAWNPAAENIFGYTYANALGRRFDSLLSLGKTAHQFNENLLRTYHNEAIPAYDTECKDKRGNIIHISITLFPIKNEESNDIDSAAAIIRDISDQKALENDLKALNQNLEFQVKTRTQELLEARNAALESSKSKSDFIANVSHEIRTPMNGVIGMLHLLEKEPCNPKQAKYLAMAKSSALALTSLINDVLDLSKIESGKMEMEKIEMDLFEVMGATCKSMAIHAHNKGLRLLLDMSQVTHALIINDANRIRQVLINLTGNAIKFTESGHIKIKVWDSELHGRQKLMFSVKDTGIGITQDKMSTLFDAFSQEDSSITRRYGGTGLGLAISKKLTNLLGGDITVDSQKGKGTEFIVSIANKPMADQTHSTCQSLAAAPINNIIYLVEPDVATRQTVEDALVALGCQYTAYDSSDTLSKHTPDESAKPLLIIHEGALTDPQMIEFGRLYAIVIISNDMEGMHHNHVSLHVPFTPIDLQHSLLSALGSETHWLTKTKNAPVDTELDALLKQHKHEKLLLVDDNDINLEVARGMLEDFPFTVDIATGGEEALHILNTANNNGMPYSVMFLDCQMPDIDGFETTRRIRNGEAGSLHDDMPIVAMTANAMSGTEQDCLKSGMNDYLTKPLDPVLFEEKVLFWLDMQSKAAKKTDSLALEKVAADVSVLNPESEARKDKAGLPSWDQASALKRVRGRVDRLLTLLDMFDSGMPEKLALMEQAVEKKDFEQCSKIAHEMKGVTANISALAMSSACADLEQAGLNRNSTGINIHAALVKKTYTTLLPILATYREQANNNKAAP